MLLVSCVRPIVSPLVLDDIPVPLHREYMIRKIRYDSLFPTNCDTVGYCMLEYIKTVPCDFSEGFMDYPEEEGVVLSNCVQVKWPLSGAHDDTIYIFETTRGLYENYEPTSETASLLLPNSKVPSRWRIAGIDSWTDWKDVITLNMRDYTVVRVIAKYDILPTYYIWALDYGLIYYASPRLEETGMYYYEYIDKENHNTILSHKISNILK